MIGKKRLIYDTAKNSAKKCELENAREKKEESIVIKRLIKREGKKISERRRDQGLGGKTREKIDIK